MTRFAVAIWPPAAVVEAVRAFERPALPEVRWSTPEQWMIKVRPLGHVGANVVTQLVDVLRDELDGAPATECTVGPVTRRLGGQWLGAPVAGLEDLAAVVFDVTAPLVPVTHPQPFRAEIVLARGRVPKELAGRPLSARFTAREVVLVADRSSPAVARFDDIATIALGR